ncbi:hypothetical protein BDM02DRAFT_3264452 [Thelephora ganbajun]|uniref:Uncharacterized protein n=1 Tax=Thelephora ganbajun TaxID=370292 RepID=A0ACB6YZ51_THEGA|nr:hypothetical protein BDM02DRAFT_3264452 [Thelephora ganbajun]
MFTPAHIYTPIRSKGSQGPLRRGKSGSPRETPTEIESLPLPGYLPYGFHIHSFHPTLSRLTFSDWQKNYVWDVRHSKFLLDERAYLPNGISFSSDGRFFVYGTEPLEIHLWKESPTGYVLHRTLNREIGISDQLMSPNGESIFAFGIGAIQLSHTVDSTASFSCKQGHTGFIVGFSPDETLAAVSQFNVSKTITVLDLKSGDPLSVIDAGMEVYGQRVTENAVIAVGREKVVTWDLPTRDHALNTKADANDSIRTATPLIVCPNMWLQFMSISLNLHSIAMVDYNTHSPSYSLHLHDVSTGRCLGSVLMRGEVVRRPWFTSDGRQVWHIMDRDEANGLTIVKDSESGVIKLEHLGPTNQPPNMPPWLSSRGYQITDDGWILGVSGKRLLRLPPHWQSFDMTRRTWSGRFLALLHHALPKAVILELEE